MILEDDSDLTSIESGDEESKPTVTTSKGSSKNTAAEAGSYAIRNTLKAPRATTYSAKSLFEAIGNGDISLEAEYQRDVVWQDTKQIGLIDSIFRNFYVPPIIFATQTHDDGSETKICIDGKQRLTSIRRFMEGHIPYKDPITSEKWYYIDNNVVSSSRTRKKILPSKLQRMFETKQIVCVEYQDITDSDEREIFQRVQLGMALTPAEKLQVISTPRSNLTRSIVHEHITLGYLNPSRLDWDATRGADFRCVASALWSITRWSNGGLKTVPTVMQLEKWLGEDEEVGEKFRIKVEETFKIFGELVADKKLGKTAFRSVYPKESNTKPKDEDGRTPAKVAPLEFVFTALLIAVHKDKMSVAELARCIGGMRKDVREKHLDVRLNGRVGKTMIEYIRALKSGPPNDDDEEEPEKPKKGGSKGKGKRKRRDEDESEMDVESGDESGSEYGGSSSKKKKAKPSTSSPRKTSTLPAAPPSLPPKPASTPKAAPTSTPSLPSRKPTPTQPSTPAHVPPSTSRMAALRAASARGMAPPSSPSGSPKVTPALPSFKRTQSSSIVHTSTSHNGHIPAAPAHTPAVNASAGSATGLPTPPGSGHIPSSWEHSAYQAQLQAATLRGGAVPPLPSLSPAQSVGAAGVPSTSSAYSNSGMAGGSAASPRPTISTNGGAPGGAGNANNSPLRGSGRWAAPPEGFSRTYHEYQSRSGSSSGRR